MKFLNIISLLIVLTVSLNLFADGDHSTPPSADGAAKLLEDGEFVLTEQAEKRMGIKWVTLKGSGPWKIPTESLVKIKFTKGVYRKFEGRIAMVILESVKSEAEGLTVASSDLMEGDQVAVSGVKYLRLAEVDISSGTVDNCSH